MIRSPQQKAVFRPSRAMAVLAACVLLGLALGGAHSARATSTQPDIVVVMVDDLGFVDDRILERLPNIHQLFVEGGLRFDHAYGETPLCCPGRAGFLSGQHTRRHHVVKNNGLPFDPSHTVATALDDAGYFTVLSGKYFNDAHKLPYRKPPGWDVSNILLGETDTASYWWRNNKYKRAGYMDREVGRFGLQALDMAPAASPVFMLLTPRAPHRLSTAPVGKSNWIPRVEQRYRNDPRCSGIEPWKPPTYNYPRKPDGWPLDDICRSLLTVDDMVADVRAKMDALGRDPLWVFMSDNGMAWGWHGYTQKNVPESTQIPVYFAGRGVTPGATDALVSNIDFGPTFAALAGTSMPFADGESFAQVLSDPTLSARTWMREDHPKGGPTRGGGKYGAFWAVRTPDWYLLHRALTGRDYLFDLTTDPWMEHDVAGSNQATVEELRELYPDV